jgi:hypothetical protein
MREFAFRSRRAALVIAAIELWRAMGPAIAQTASSRIDEALQNITALVRSGRIGYATFWDGNKYIQCRRMPERALRCEAAGTSMQPSLRNALTGDRLSRLAALGWALDPSFGNYAQTFPADAPTGRLADQILQTLTEAYGAEPPNLEVQTEWVADVACPPRNGPAQSLAGLISDAPSMRKFALRACSYTPDSQTPQTARSSAELVAIYGATATAEIQRLRINAGRKVYVSFNAGIGYVQCMPETPPTAMYCEAQSAESWPALTTILTDERVLRLRAAGYADPGRAPNYWKSYPLEKFSDAAIATELLTILHEVYGYTGATKLKILTE